MADASNVEILKRIQEKTSSKIVATTSNKYSFQRKNGNPYEKTKYYKYVLELARLGLIIDDITPCIEENKEIEIKT